MSPSPADGLVSINDSATDPDSIPVRCITLSKSGYSPSPVAEAIVSPDDMHIPAQKRSHFCPAR